MRRGGRTSGPCALLLAAGLLAGRLRRADAKGCDGYSCSGHGTCKMSCSGFMCTKKPSCSCNSGYRGAHCDGATGCDNADCGHGTCVASGGAHSCDCHSGYTGVTCSHSTGCDSQPDCGHGTCVATGASYTCSCNDGWSAAGSGKTCSHATGCDSRPASNCNGHGTCTAPPANEPNKGAGHTCACDGGWKTPASDCSTCAAPCRNEKPDPNAMDKCTPDGQCLGATCSATCRAGYSGTGVSYTCDIHGSWAPAAASLSCSAKTCTKVPTPHSNTATGTFEDRKAITATCKSGYYRVDPTTGTGEYSCQLSGGGGAVDWLPVDGSPGRTCKPKRCSGNPSKDDNNVQKCDGYQFGQTCTATCYNGYTASGESVYTCSNKGSESSTQIGEWTGGSLVCTPKKCTKRPTLHSEKASGDYTRPADGQIPNKIDATCSSGYYSQGTGKYSCQLLTGSGGAVDWNLVGSQGRTCLPKKCSKNPSKDVNVEDCAPKTYGQTCTAKCYPGYTGSGVVEYSCENLGTPATEGGQWVGGSLDCAPITCKKAAPKGVGHAQKCKEGTYDRSHPAECINLMSGQHNFKLGWPCIPGYNKNLRPDSTKYTCDSNGEWTQTESQVTSKVALTCIAKECKGYPATTSPAIDPEVPENHDPHSLCTGQTCKTDCSSKVTGRFDGQTCKAKCTTGYQNTAAGNGSSTLYTCLNAPGERTAYWGKDVRQGDFATLVCRGVPCGNSPPGCSGDACTAAPNTQKCEAGIYSDSGDPEFTYSGTECPARCRPGYERLDGSESYVCDSEGHWVVGTKALGPTPLNKAVDLECKGQKCPDNGVAPHGFATGLPVDVKNEKDGQVWPYVEFEPCTSNTPRNALFYSDDCANPKSGCSCTGRCDAGYSENGTIEGVTTRKFECHQEDNKPFFWSPADPSASLQHQADALVCKAITCGDVMTWAGMDGGGQGHVQHLVEGEEHWIGEIKRCGVSNGVPQDPPGEMRFDRDPETHNNKCIATCAEGYTEHNSSQFVQHFTCDPRSDLEVNEPAWHQKALRRRAQTSPECQSQSECGSGDYCGDDDDGSSFDGDCYLCSDIPSYSDCVGGCCSAAFLEQCPDNPAGCDTECSSHSDCNAGEYCDDSGDCDECSDAEDNTCDAVDGNCCTVAFLEQCPDNPAACHLECSPMSARSGCKSGTYCVHGFCLAPPTADHSYAVTVSGSGYKKTDGIYYRTSAQCNGQSVFQHDSKNLCMYQPTSQEQNVWVIGRKNKAEKCKNDPNRAGGLRATEACETSPNMCVTGWRVFNGSSWVTPPQFSVVITGYTISGSTRSYLNGLYARTNLTCQSSPVYQRNGYVMKRTSSHSMMVGSLDGENNSVCAKRGYIDNSHFPANVAPDAKSAVGRWDEKTYDCGEHSTWCPNPDLVVTGSTPDPCSSVQPYERIDCGFPGISKDECVTKSFFGLQCCYDKLPQGTLGPSCFYVVHGPEPEPEPDLFGCIGAQFEGDPNNETEFLDLFCGPGLDLSSCTPSEIAEIGDEQKELCGEYALGCIAAQLEHGNNETEFLDLFCGQGVDYIACTHGQLTALHDLRRLVCVLFRPPTCISSQLGGDSLLNETAELDILCGPHLDTSTCTPAEMATLRDAQRLTCFLLHPPACILSQLDHMSSQLDRDVEFCQRAGELDTSKCSTVDRAALHNEIEVGCGGEPEPRPAPEPQPAPDPQPAPEPEPLPGPDATHRGFGGSLKCNIIQCPEDPLQAISDGHDNWAHANRSTWTSCKSTSPHRQGDGSEFGKSCLVVCNTGFTKSVPATAHIKPYTCESIADDKFVHGDPRFKRYGRWRFTQNDVCTKHPCDNVHLKCEAVICPELVRPTHTIGWEEDAYGPKTLKDLKKCVSARNFKCDSPGGHKCGPNERRYNDEFQRFEDRCTMECLAGWYPKSDTKRSVDYTCSQPADESGDGVWCPGPNCTGLTGKMHEDNIILECEAGKLAPNNSSLILETDEDTGTRVDAAALPWPRVGSPSNSIIQEHGPGLGDDPKFPKRAAKISSFLGWKFGTGTGPKYKFLIQARDNHDQPRDYRNLPGTIHADYVVVKIDRVPRDRVSPADFNLQPAKEWDPAEVPAKPKTNAVREYKGIGIPGQAIAQSSTDRGPKSFQFKDSKAETAGTWEYNHQFLEFGVFYLSIWICPDTVDGKKSCDNQEPTHLIPGTGFTGEDGEDLAPGKIPPSTFTVCPQNTFATPDNANTGMVLGSKLSTCVAQIGHFSPEGPGHIAEKCTEQGFFCGFPGMTWPVAKPGYWVDNYKPTLVQQCKLLGACPGGMQYGVGTDKWRDVGGDALSGGVPEQACWDLDNQTLRFTECSGDKCTVECTANGGGCADFNAPLKPNPCFTGTQYIIREKSGAYNLKQGIENGTMIRCRDQVGNRCCPGNRGDGCESCCMEENLATSLTPSCNSRQWHSVDTSEGGSCHICPEQKLDAVLFIVVGFLILLFAPIIAKLSELAKHAGAAQGPVLSIMNFFQASDLFQGLDLNWPIEFRTFCRTVASLFSFNISDLLKKFNAFISKFITLHLPKWLHDLIPNFALPPPACALHLSYEKKWMLSMASPLFVVLTMVTLVIFQTIAGAAAKQLIKCFPKSASRLKARTCCCCCKKQDDSDGSDSDDARTKLDSLAVILDDDPEAEPSIEPEAEQGDSPRQRRCAGQRWEKISSDFRNFLRRISRAVLIYLMIGYVFLARSALEPLSCKTTLDGTEYIKAGAATDIQCSWCETSGDAVRILSYRSLATLAIVFYTIYGLGTPLLFSIILISNRNRLHTNRFMSGFGFLSSKMREETYWWEVLISFRKLLLVSFVMWSPGQELAFTLINLFVAVGALTAQAWVRPFANVDANLAETVTLLCTILMLILGLGSGTSDEGGDGVKGKAQVYLNYSIYAVSGVCVIIATVVLCKRLVGALHSCCKGSKIVEMEEHFKGIGGAVPDDVREMLHKRKLQLAVAWVSLKSNDEKSGKLIKSAVNPLIATYPLTHQERMVAIFESAKKYQRSTELLRLSEWEGYFPKKLRPAMYAWSMRDDAQAQAEADELNWFIDQMKLFEKEQHTVFPNFIQRCIKAANDEDEDDEDEDEDDDEDGHPDSRAASVVKISARATVTAPNRSIRLRHNSVAATMDDDPRQSLRATWAALQMPQTPTEVELENCAKRFRRQLKRAPTRLVHALKDVANGCKYLFFGNVSRITLSFLLMMTCWAFTVYCAASFAADQAEGNENSQESGQLSVCKEKAHAQQHSQIWFWYALIFYVNLLVVVPLTALIYNSGRRPLFLAVKEPNPDEGIGSTELIQLAKSVVAREMGKPRADRDGYGHLATEERSLIGLSRRKAERLVQFVCMTTSDQTRVLTEAELIEILATIENFEWLVAFTFLLTTVMIGVDSILSVKKEGIFFLHSSIFEWTPAAEAGKEGNGSLKISPCVGVLGCWYCLLLVIYPIGRRVGRQFKCCTEPVRPRPAADVELDDLAFGDHGSGKVVGGSLTSGGHGLRDDGDGDELGPEHTPQELRLTSRSMATLMNAAGSLREMLSQPPGGSMTGAAGGDEEDGEGGRMGGGNDERAPSVDFEPMTDAEFDALQEGLLTGGKDGAAAAARGGGADVDADALGGSSEDDEDGGNGSRAPPSVAGIISDVDGPTAEEGL